MGSPWKMPTYNQANELINNTTSTWTTINGVNGRKFATMQILPNTFFFQQEVIGTKRIFVIANTKVDIGVLNGMILLLKVHWSSTTPLLTKA